jgi:hypothetical protein
MLTGLIADGDGSGALGETTGVIAYSDGIGTLCDVSG